MKQMKYFHVSSQCKAGDILYPSPVHKPHYKEYIPLLNALESGGEPCLIDFYNTQFIHSDIKEWTGRRPSKWLAEVIFDVVRPKELPSRLLGLFLCDTKEAAHQFIKDHRADRADITYIFEVHIPAQTIHQFDMDIFSKAETKLDNQKLSKALLHDIKSIAQEYWNECSSNCPTKELLYDKEVKLLCIVK